MRIKEEYKKIGKFWIPSNKSNKVHGTLFIKDGGEIELVTDGKLSTSDNIQRIIGHIEQNGLVTLEKCLKKRDNNNLGVIKQTFYIERAYLGTQDIEKGKIHFNSFCFSIERLNEWVGVSGIETYRGNNFCGINRNKTNYNFSVKYKQPKKILYQIKNEGKDNDFQLNFYIDCSTPAYSSKEDSGIQIKEKAYINLVSFEKLPIEDFISLARKITYLICFSINDIVCVNDVIVTSDEIKDENNKPVDIKMYYRSRPFTKKNIDGMKAHLFSYQNNEIKKNIEKIINSWISISNEADPAFDLYFSTQEVKDQFLELKFLTLVHSLEAYHKKVVCTKRVNLRKRIEEMMCPFKKYIGDDIKCKKIMDHIMDTRNYFTHYDKEKKSKALVGQGLYIICLMLEGIFQLTLLKQLDLISSQDIKFIATEILKYKLEANLTPWEIKKNS